MLKDAIFDKSQKYRYLLKRQWKADTKNFVNFILLNPSTADEKNDDPTINACIQFAKNSNYDGLWITNLFAFRATKPHNLKLCSSPIGKQNNQYLKNYAKKSKMVIIAWGNHGNFLDRNKEVIKILSKTKTLYCLDITNKGNPKHPLYIKRTTKPLIFSNSN